jgi:tight adherence protein B
LSGLLNLIKIKRIRNLVIPVILGGIFYIFFKNILLALFMSACLSVYAIDALKGRDEVLAQNLHRQIIEFLEHMVIMLGAGKTLRYIFLNSWKKFPDPIGKCLKKVAENIEINPDLEDVTAVFENTIKTREAKLIASGIRINNKIGGDIVILLNSISKTLRENLRLKSHLDSLTLQSRFSANIIGILPVASLMFLYFFHSDRMLDFFSRPSGMIVLIIGGSLEITGIIILKKITGR